MGGGLRGCREAIERIDTVKAMKSKLFAALDSAGVVRFVSEVERGAACGCFCPVCASPLVARQGHLKEWHFAHEASQERVECEVGALNMLRRVAAEMLQRQPLPVLTSYSQKVTGRSSTSLVTAVASWPAQIVSEGLQWETGGLQSRPFVSGMLTTGVPFDAFIEVSDQYPRFPPATDQKTAHLVYWIRTPVQADLHKRIYLEQHIGRVGQWVWLSHPEHHGMVASARLKAQQQADEAEHSLLEKLARMQEERRRSMQLVSDAKERSNAEWRAQQAAKAANVPDDSVPWAPQRKPHSSFLFYKLRDGQGTWVVYTRFDGSNRMVPLPAFDGWDESMPPTIGIPELGETAYRTTDLIQALGYLSPRAEQIRTTSSASEIELLAGLG